METLEQLNNQLINSKKEFINGLIRIIKQGKVNVIFSNHEIFIGKLRIWVANSFFGFEIIMKSNRTKDFTDCKDEVKKLILALPENAKKYRWYTDFIDIESLKD